MTGDSAMTFQMFKQLRHVIPLTIHFKATLIEFLRTCERQSILEQSAH